MSTYEFKCSRCSYTQAVEISDEEKKKVLSQSGYRLRLRDKESANQLDDHHLVTRKPRTNFGHRVLQGKINGTDLAVELIGSATDALDAPASADLINESN